jgi:hypothetical protein
MPATAEMIRWMLRPDAFRANWLLRVLLVLSLWHAPIPWVHAHDLDGPDVARLQMLSQHIAAFHTREIDLGQQRLEWHVHFVLPWCMIHHHPGPDDEHGPDADDFIGGSKVCAAGMNSGETIGAPTTRAFLAWNLACDLVAISVAVDGPGFSIRESASARQFFTTYGTASVRDLVGVRLC